MGVFWIAGLLLAVDTVELPAWVDVRNELGKQFKLVEAHLVVDGQEVARRVAPPGEELERTFRLWDATLTASEHGLTVELVLEGRNRGPFSYLDNYTYRVSSELRFAVDRDGPHAGLEVVARERRGPNVPPEKRPQLAFEPEPFSAIAKPILAPRPPPAAPPPQ